MWSASVRKAVGVADGLGAILSVAFDGTLGLVDHRVPAHACASAEVNEVAEQIGDVQLDIGDVRLAVPIGRHAQRVLGLVGAALVLSLEVVAAVRAVLHRCSLSVMWWSAPEDAHPARRAGAGGRIQDSTLSS